MGYYNIELSDKSKELCTIVTQKGKYEYQRLPMGLCNTLNIFQEKNSEPFFGLDTLHVYINAILHVSKGSWTDHLTVLEDMFTRLQNSGIKVNSSKSCFDAHKIYYLVYHVTHDGVMPISKKFEAIQALAVPKTRKKLRHFIGVIKFYPDTWQKRSELLFPWTALTSQNVKYECKYEHQKCFDAIKHVIGREVLLAHPDFNAPFEIHTDASKLQIGTVISHKGKRIAFYSRKMNSS